MSSPREELAALVREIQPLIANQNDRVAGLAYAHRKLTAYARLHHLHQEDWPDMVLRMLLEYERRRG